jgi:hypothetical protein
MGRVVIVVAPDAGFAPVAAAWHADGEIFAAGTAEVEAAGTMFSSLA